ncbi:hypothetical protein [Ideonella sp.]|jgi:hypothetical protein|uniref:hypothetical protein n=1 Tax=Ideonella sp. TaxID=1929293 RepID=UPI0037C0CB71
MKNPFNHIIDAAREGLLADEMEFEEAYKQPAYQVSLQKMRKTVQALHQTLGLCDFAATRWADYHEKYLLPRHKDEIGEAAVMAKLAIENGALNSSRREMRYMLEVAVNTAFIDETAAPQDLEGRIQFYRGKQVCKNNVDHVRQLPLRMLTESQRQAFREATSAAWVDASNYVHLTKRRIDEKVKQRAEGVRLGFETPEMLAGVVHSLHDACSIVVVLAFETIGPDLTGDLLVDGRLDTFDDWPFHQNRFVAALDAHFDYRHERQSGLQEHIARRQRRLAA